MIFAWYTYYFRTKRNFENIQNLQIKTQKDKQLHKYYLRVKHLPFQLNKKQQQQFNSTSQIATKNEQNQNTIDQIHFQDLQVKKIQQEINLSLPTYLGTLDYQQIQQAKIQIKGYQNSKNLQNLEQIFLKYKQQIYACLSALNELSNNSSQHFNPYCQKALLKKKQKAQKKFNKLQKLKDQALELYKKRHINGVDDGKLLNSDLLGQEVIIYFETKEQTYLAQKILQNNNNKLISGLKFFFFPGSLNYSDRLALKMIPFEDLSWENFGQPPKFKILKRLVVLFIGTPLTLTLILLAEIILFFAILYEYEFMNDEQTWKYIIQNSMTGLLSNIVFSFFSFQVLIYKMKHIMLKITSFKKKKMENMCQIQFNEQYYTPPIFCLEEQIGKIISQITVGTFYLVVAPYLLFIPAISIILSLKALKYQIQHNSQDLKQQSHKIPKHLIGKWFIKNQVILCFIMVFNLPDFNHSSKNKAYLIFYFFTIYFTFGYCTVRSILKKRKKNKEKILSNFYTKNFIQQLFSKENQLKQQEEIQISRQNKNQNKNQNQSIIDLNYSHISVENLNQGQEEEKIQEQNRAKFSSLGNFNSYQNYEQQFHLQAKNFSFQEKLNEHSTSLDVRQFDCIFNHIKDQISKDKLDLENQVY
ncbi:hypothetical protein PPERSA_03136 [Pseudocohnilembus persalinus]|uniref:Uncharacterized protein n=1 Tax=Pseudocohnilembus persalinus TaxID=266149 RepID=A0A0V0QIZ9_PSEPJ|nr:hypothetical protein PPERSA_03136 [Pseudocohnilembus persalinus]|eukprot:KRX02074.1 hypothetical protein PPERSA_03136 [Pseudocohnilembus persalinus]